MHCFLLVVSLAGTSRAGADTIAMPVKKFDLG
jgi:hypothetical protein